MELNSLAFGPIGKSFFQHMLMDSHLRFLSPLIVDGQSLPCVAHLAGSLCIYNNIVAEVSINRTNAVSNCCC
jgi:hypothetical protein